MLIKMVRGNYGLPSGKSVKVKTPKDRPFDVDQKEAERLVRLGIAKIVGAGAAVSAKEPSDKEDPFGDPADDIDAPVSLGDSEEDGDTDIEYDEDDVGEDDNAPEYGENSTNAELQAIAKEYGVEVPPHANKAQLLEALDVFFSGAPEIGAKEPE